MMGGVEEESAMTVKEWEDQLHKEGFSRIYVWQVGPGAFYADHTHPTPPRT